MLGIGFCTWPIFEYEFTEGIRVNFISIGWRFCCHFCSNIVTFIKKEMTISSTDPESPIGIYGIIKKRKFKKELEVVFSNGGKLSLD